MDTAVAEMRDWDEHPYDGGYAGLHDLAGSEFTGTVEAAGNWLFMLRGRVVGVFEERETETGDTEFAPVDIDRFEDTPGTAREAPHPSLPLLYAMRATGGEERGRYYTENTPLEEVHEKLSDGGFTGYVELSENVLSGDYYLVYHGGRSKQVAFVGQSRRLLEDDEAFERAADEVGIYTVTAVDLDVIDIPGEPERSGAGAAGAAGAAGTAGATSAGGDTQVFEGDDPTAADDTDAVDEVEAGAGAVDESDASGGAVDAAAGAGAVDAADAEGSAADEPGPSIDIPDAGPDPADDDTDDPSPGPRDTGTEEPARDAATAVQDTTEGETDDGPAPEPVGDAADSDIEAAVASVETEPDDATDDATDEATDDAPGGGGDAAPADAAPEDEADDGATPDAGDEPPAVATLRGELEDREAEIERLEAELRTTRDERDDLRARVENLERRLQELGSGAAAPDRSITPEEALAETSLFVRYRSKSDPTLDDLRSGADRGAVVGNLKLEEHTEFDVDAVAVDGRAFDAFLEDTREHRFVRWLVTDLPLEIRGTGSTDSVEALYDAIPDIDRVVFDAPGMEGDEDAPQFDVVARDRKGNPLVVAMLGESREPVQRDELAEFVRDATDVSESTGSLAGAMAVTTAFFEPGALDVAEQATSKSLLSRDRRRSFVKRSRSQGYHLCLVESRDDSFYLSVPDL